MSGGTNSVGRYVYTGSLHLRGEFSCRYCPQLAPNGTGLSLLSVERKGETVILLLTAAGASV